MARITGLRPAAGLCSWLANFSFKRFTCALRWKGCPRKAEALARPRRCSCEIPQPPARGSGFPGLRTARRALRWSDPAAEQRAWLSPHPFTGPPERSSRSWRGPDLHLAGGSLLRALPLSHSSHLPRVTPQPPGKVTWWARRRVINTFRRGPNQHPPPVQSTPSSGWPSQHPPQADPINTLLRPTHSTSTSGWPNQRPPHAALINTHLRIAQSTPTGGPVGGAWLATGLPSPSGTSGRGRSYRQRGGTSCPAEPNFPSVPELLTEGAWQAACGVVFGGLRRVEV